ncbi:MAG: hypothetical protein ACXWUG_26555, partial [Polyangiales bacterium]
CDAQTEVVSANRCMHYGQTWATERTFRVVVGSGFFSGGFDASNRDYTVRADSNKGATGTRYSGDRLGIGMVRTYGLDLDIHGFVTDHAYIGLDMAFGLGRAAPRYAIAADGYSFGQTSGPDLLQVRMGGTFGVRIPTPYLSLRAETLVGVEVIAISHDATPTNGGATERGSSTAVSFLVEPRIAVDLWTAPWATMSLWAGKDIFHLRDTSTGIMFALHGRSFDGGL